MSKITIKKEEGRAAVGSCLRGYIKISYAQLVRTFGEPASDGDGYKTDAEWTVRIEGELVTIYNYKNGPNYNRTPSPTVEEITEWNLGGFSHKSERSSEASRSNPNQQPKGATKMKTTNRQDATLSLASQLASKVYDNTRDSIQMLVSMEARLAKVGILGEADSGIRDIRALQESMAVALTKATTLAEDLSRYYKPMHNHLLGRDGKILHPTVPGREE